MSIPRYLLTLILAAFAVSVVYFAFHEGPALVRRLSTGDPKLLAASISSAIITVIIGFPRLVVLGYLVWRLVSLVYLRPAAHPRPLLSYAIAGIITQLILYAGISAPYFFSVEGFDITGIVWGIAVALVAGAVWGGVFCKMDPRSRTNQLSPIEEF